MRAALLAVALITTGSLYAAEPATFKAGVATSVITPKEPLWMAGYASRTKPAEEKQHDLYVKAVALEDALGGRLVLVTSDLIGIPRSLRQAVVAEVEKRTKLPPARLRITASHTHCGPVLSDNLTDMYDLPPDMPAKIKAYTETLTKQMIEVVVRAIDDLKPARLTAGQGTARFAMNRCKPTDKGFINDANPDGPVDHDVPVLRIEGPDGRLRAAVMGYACHNTTMQFFQWCGDYAGFAQLELEKKHPGAIALFWAGCGGDQNPLPRSKIELCEKYGKQLAEAVNDVLKEKMTPITGTLDACYDEITLNLDTIPDKERFTADLLSKTFAVRKRAERMLKTLADSKKIDDSYSHYPVQTWRLGEQVLWTALGGEVVVDYSLRLKKELRDLPALWVTAYANDVMAYIPSERVLKEGGYEGDSSMIYYGFPTKWAPGLEDRIVGKVRDQVRSLLKGKP
jgi:hypothetical protein